MSDVAGREEHAARYGRRSDQQILDGNWAPAHLISQAPRNPGDRNIDWNDVYGARGQQLVEPCSEPGAFARRRGGDAGFELEHRYDAKRNHRVLCEEVQQT